MDLCGNRLRTAALLAAIVTGDGGAARAAEGPKFALPIDCRPGVDCIVQNYFDHDPGPDRRDHMCGHMTYDGHDGIDFRLPSFAAMRHGVMVEAAAAGRVVSMRDGVADDGLARGRDAVRGTECGNGVVIDHGGGWVSQYCHLAEGSLTVTQGSRVTRGEVLGRVGYSGETQFPHLHLTIRRDGRSVDPFAPDRPLAACGAGPTLWTPEAEAALAYRSPFVLEAGFVGENIEITQLEEHGLTEITPRHDQPALVAVTRTIGLETGDVISLDLYDPSGRLVARNAPAAFDRPKAQWMLLAGRRHGTTGFMPGTWHAVHRVERGGRVVAEKTFGIDMPAK